MVTRSLPIADTTRVDTEPTLRYINAPANDPATSASKKAALRFLDRFFNPHNCGSINRSTQAAVAIAVLISVIASDLDSTTWLPDANARSTITADAWGPSRLTPEVFCNPAAPKIKTVWTRLLNSSHSRNRGPII